MHTSAYISFLFLIRLAQKIKRLLVKLAEWFFWVSRRIVLCYEWKSGEKISGYNNVNPSLDKEITWAGIDTQADDQF